MKSMSAHRVACARVRAWSHASVAAVAQVVLRPGAETLSIEAQLRQGGRDGDGGDGGDEGGGGAGAGAGDGEALGVEGPDAPGVVKSEEVGVWQSRPLVRTAEQNGREATSGVEAA